MAASVIRTISGFGLTRPVRTCFIPMEEEEPEDEYEEELREEVEDRFEEDDSSVTESQEDEPWTENPSFGQNEITDRLLQFAELISSDVQRYFGRGHDPDACDIYAERERLEVSGRQRYYADFMRVASSEEGAEPEKLGPLAELFREAHRKRQGLPMTQRCLPSSFWTEPRPCQLVTLDDADTPYALRCSTESTLSTSNTPVSTISSSSTPDFSDLLAQWATDRDSASEFSCDYQLP
ncbi:protein PERCC1 [Astyanax mexicanus]|uniref:protein PERCC1 n=1 Tax=Astyanax mexicanus TaxID=7994 RepID=UPI000769FC88|nr:protein PERCC1 [Astyanax mexicanus]